VIDPGHSVAHMIRPATTRQLAFLRSLRKELGDERKSVPDTRQGAYMAIRSAKAKLAAIDHLHPVVLQRPTDAQLHDLAVLAKRAGEPVPTPRHRGDAAQHLARLRSQSEPKEPSLRAS
jgi:hypothetical protein